MSSETRDVLADTRYRTPKSARHKVAGYVPDKNRKHSVQL